MPRKKSDEGKPVDATGIEMKAVRVEISPEMHRLLRRVAAADDMSMAAYAKERLEKIIREDAKRKEIK
jgi:predicted HicB family RNase H-like nuclease